jgi:hypothetical protein
MRQVSVLDLGHPRLADTHHLGNRTLVMSLPPHVSLGSSAEPHRVSYPRPGFLKARKLDITGESGLTRPLIARHQDEKSSLICLGRLRHTLSSSRANMQAVTIAACERDHRNECDQCEGGRVLSGRHRILLTPGRCCGSGAAGELACTAQWFGRTTLHSRARNHLHRCRQINPPARVHNQRADPRLRAHPASNDRVADPKQARGTAPITGPFAFGNQRSVCDAQCRDAELRTEVPVPTQPYEGDRGQRRRATARPDAWPERAHSAP